MKKEIINGANNEGQKRQIQ